MSWVTRNEMLQLTCIFLLKFFATMIRFPGKKISSFYVICNTLQYRQCTQRTNLNENILKHFYKEQVTQRSSKFNL